jgi:DNA-binding MarR family transcriptional regulator
MADDFDLAGIDPVLQAPARLAVMAMLATGDEVEFTLIRDRLDLTDGNLASHLRKLEDAGYVACSKGFVGRRPRTTYQILPRGRAAFVRHVAGLERIIGVAGRNARDR